MQSVTALHLAFVQNKQCEVSSDDQVSHFEVGVHEMTSSDADEKLTGARTRSKRRDFRVEYHGIRMCSLFDDKIEKLAT